MGNTADPLSCFWLVLSLWESLQVHCRAPGCVSWSLSIAPHTSLHTSHELPVPEHDVILPEAGVVPFFRDFNFENACIDGSVNLLHVIEVLNVRGFGILDGTFIVS